MSIFHLVGGGHGVEPVGQEAHHDAGHDQETAHHDPEYEEGGAVGEEAGGVGRHPQAELVLALGGRQEEAVPWPRHREDQVVREVRAADVLLLSINTDTVTPHDEVVLDIQSPDCQQRPQTKVVVILDASRMSGSVPITFNLNKEEFIRYSSVLSKLKYNDGQRLSE